jgi:hypothetical protein
MILLIAIAPLNSFKLCLHAYLVIILARTTLLLPELHKQMIVSNYTDPSEWK